MIVIGENTHALVAGQFQVNPLPPKALKGKDKPVATFEVLATSAAALAAPPGRES
jgi:class 3 adenylate cyclase